MLKQNRHAAQFAGYVSVTHELGFAGVRLQIVQLQAGIDVEFPVTPTHSGQSALAAVIEKGFGVFVALDEGSPFAGRIPGAAQRHGGVDGFFLGWSGDECGFALKHGHKVAAINYPAFGHLDPGEGGQCGIPIHRAGERTRNGAALDAEAGAPRDGRHADACLVS